MSADYLGQFEDPVHFKQFWRRALRDVHQDWERLTSTPGELDVNDFPSSRLAIMTRIRY